MALSDSQKQEVVFYLGWSAKSIIVDSTNYNSQVADRLNNLNAVSEVRVGNILDQLETTDLRLGKAGCRLAAKRVDEIELNPDEIRMLRSERRRLVRLLSEYLDIPSMASNGTNVNICM